MWAPFKIFLPIIFLSGSVWFCAQGDALATPPTASGPSVAGEPSSVVRILRQTAAGTWAVVRYEGILRTWKPRLVSRSALDVDWCTYGVLVLAADGPTHTDYLIGEIATSEYTSLQEALRATATSDPMAWGPSVAWHVTARLEPFWYVCLADPNTCRALRCGSRAELDRALFIQPPCLAEIREFPDVALVDRNSCVSAGDWLLRLRVDGRFEILNVREPLGVTSVEGPDGRGCALPEPEGDRAAMLGTTFTQRFSSIGDAIAAIRARGLSPLPYEACWELPLGRACSNVVRYRPGPAEPTDAR